jgi:putative transposase
MNLFPALLVLSRTLFASRLELVAENLALRQQLAVLNRKAKRPKLQSQDRLFWATLSSLSKNWRSALIIVKPDTVLRWHRQGFRL